MGLRFQDLSVGDVLSRKTNFAVGLSSNSITSIFRGKKNFAKQSLNRPDSYQEGGYPLLNGQIVATRRARVSYEMGGKWPVAVDISRSPTNWAHDLRRG